MQAAAFAARSGSTPPTSALDVAPERLAEAVAGAHALGFQGLNVTVPHKRRGRRAVRRRWMPVAREVGAVNTLRARPSAAGRASTPTPPACLALLERGGPPAAARARSSSAPAGRRAPRRGRSSRGGRRCCGSPRAAPDAARERLAAELAPLAPAGAPAPAAVPWGELAARGGRARESVVNGTSIGLHAGRTRRCRSACARGQVAVDFVYGETALARAARDAGARLVSGEQLLVRQGALAFTLWTGRAAPEALMAAAVAAPGRMHMTLRYLTAGESHGPALVAIAEGFPAGLADRLRRGEPRPRAGGRRATAAAGGRRSRRTRRSSSPACAAA